MRDRGILASKGIKLKETGMWLVSFSCYSNFLMITRCQQFNKTSAPVDVLSIGALMLPFITNYFSRYLTCLRTFVIKSVAVIAVSLTLSYSIL